MTKYVTSLAIFLAAMFSGFTFAVEDPPTEIGSVGWQRDWDQSTQLAQSSGKPRLVLFQEVPG